MHFNEIIAAITKDITDETLNEEETNNSNFLEINPNNSNIQDEDIDNILTYELSDFVFSNEASDNSFLKIVKGQKEILSKAQLIQMISYDKKKVSSDTMNVLFGKETIVSKGDYVVLKVGDQTIAVCVLNLKFMKGKSKAQVLHVKDNVNLKRKKSR
ncbi:hypothetical protein PVAND_001542 [Polypedilum vanderplanki]|uniref:Uncharacterized protein n=1 Tax=Polypedilum vanderplanki TaxID=319348 RepID=A0A9J6BPK2_POLVA|nr:hypothetical protein PVAND_001542 [Polypedilum vanderplanki]